MFQDIPKEIRDRMRFLEELDAKHRAENAPREQRLRQVPRETGQFLALLAATAPDGQYIEIGTSGGYSALWISLACRLLGRKLTTFEILEEKATLAQETFLAAGIGDIVQLVKGDALEHLPGYIDVSFCFLDAEKELYSRCYETVVPNMIAGGILAADNVISHKRILKPVVARVVEDERVDALVVPIGSGVLICRKL
jgi:predicted O-methyltransferase YrrM